MSSSKALYDPGEFSRRGQEIYERIVRPNLQREDNDKFVAIDVVSGKFVIDPSDFIATERLLADQPEAQTWLVRVGQPAAYRIGGGLVSGGRE